jgi:hypothetical protein
VYCFTKEKGGIIQYIMSWIDEGARPSIRRQGQKSGFPNAKLHDRIQWNGIDLLLLFFMLYMGVHSVAGFFSVPTQVIDVSTFDSISNIDNSTEDALGISGYTNTEAITAIKLLVFGGEDDVAGDSGLDFFGFPPPNSVQGITSAPPQSSPCLNSATANCSTFLGADNKTAGPIKVQIRSSMPTFRYKLTKTTITVPYAYLDHNSPFLYCPPEAPDRTDNKCKKAPAQYVSYDTNPLMNDYQLEDEQQETCRGLNNKNLGDVEWYNEQANQEFITPGCFGCPIGKHFGSKNILSAPSHFCPFAVSHTPFIPVIDTSDFRGDQKLNIPCDGSYTANNCEVGVYSTVTADLASLEDYYFWCYGNNVGSLSNNNIYVNASLESSTNAGQYFDMIKEYDTAYKCTLAASESVEDLSAGCRPYRNVNKIVTEQGEICYLVDEKPKPGDNPNTTVCSNSRMEQITAAVSFLTASCDADDSAENMSPSNFDDVGGFYEYTCPGSQWGHITPQVSHPDIYDGIWFARCSAGCSDKNTVVHSSVKPSDTKKNPDDYTVQTVMREKASIELGPVTCDVYRIDSRPRAIMTVEIIISSPDGTTLTQSLSTDGFSFDTGKIGDVEFSSRINRIDPGGPMGTTLDGLIVICGTNDAQDVSMCGGLSAPQAPYYIDDQAECTTPYGGAIRGVFPRADPNIPGGILPGIPTTNPWPDLIKKMAEDFQAECGQDCLKNAPDFGPGFTGDPTSGDYTTFKRKSCATPTPTYLSVLNCGRRVSWYYVDEINTQNYGSECGRLGFRNLNAKTTGGAKFMCQQGDFTCTPGFGTPRYGTSAASTRVKSPCQEQGILTRYNQETITFEGCKGDKENRPLNLPPGWTWADPVDTTPGGHDKDDLVDGVDYNVGNVPNMWIDGTYLYRQPASNEASSMNLEIEIYTNTFFGGSYITYAPGEIDTVYTLYCDATIDIAKTGIAEVVVCNTSPDSGGTYNTLTTCGFSDSSIQGPNVQNISVSVDNPTDSFPLSAKNCSLRSITFSAEGPINITQIWCTTTLYPGIAPGLQSLDSVVYSCDIKIPKAVDLGKHALYQGANYQVCKGQGDLICHLSQQPDWSEAILFIFFIGLYIVVIYYVYNIVKSAILTQQNTKIIQDESERLIKSRKINALETAKLTAEQIKMS